MKFIASFLFILLIFLQIQLWFGGHGVFQLWSLNRDIQQEQNDNDSLMQRNERLHAEVKELKEGREALEERARSQLGFIREGEKFYRVIPQKDRKSP
jgi:cell division protein FtsB